MATQNVPDPFDSADKAQPRETGNKHYFGSVLVDAWHAVLVKGEGKVVFDPARHSADQRVTALEIVVTPLPRAGGVDYQIKREMIAESNEWAKIVKPSLEKLGTNLKALQNRYVQVELVETGRSYVNKSGETKKNTTFRFVAVYDDQGACQAACDGFYSMRTGNNTNGANGQQPAPAPNGANGGSAERTMAAKFLPALYASAKKTASDAGKPDEVVSFFGTEIQKNQLTSKHFTLDSQEVIDVVMANSQ